MKLFKTYIVLFKNYKLFIFLKSNSQSWQKER